MNIILTRAEGFAHECGKPANIETFKAANALLSRWSHTAPTGGCYDKCDFKIEAPEIEFSYAGRYDLKHYSEELPDLQAHVLGHLDFISGKKCPAHMTPERYDNYLRNGLNFTDEDMQKAADVRNWLAAQE